MIRSSGIFNSWLPCRIIAIAMLLAGCASKPTTKSSTQPSPSGTLSATASTTMPAANETAKSPAAEAASPLPPAPLLDSIPAGPPHAKRVIIISIDGLRPDVLLRAKMPTVRQMMNNGCFTFYAKTVHEAYTLPAHISMLTGTVPARHGVTWNDHVELAYSEVPTIFDLAKKNGLRTAAFTGKTKFICLQRPGSLDWCTFGLDTITPDELTAHRAADLLIKEKPEVMFVHLAEVDEFGHSVGWGSPEQVAAAGGADQAVRLIMQTLVDQNLIGETCVIVTSDHGGEGTNHGPDDVRSELIPWIITGPGVRRNVDLTRFKDLTINTEDTFATACVMLGMAAPGPLDGKPITQIFESSPSPSTAPAAAQ